MRFALLMMAFGIALRARGDDPAPVPPAIVPQESIIEFTPQIGCSHYAGVDAILGLPSGLRAQFGVLHREKYTLAIDGLVGALATRHDIVTGVAGGGPRLIWNYFSDSQANAFQINPGCYFLGVTQSCCRSGLLVAPTVDFIWIHDFVRHAALHAGVELGAGYDSRGDWFPVVAIFAGLRF